MRKKNRSVSLLHFKRWGNKAYSAFSSLHQAVKVCVLSSAYFVSLGTATTLANTPDDVSKKISLDEIEVSAEASEVTMDSELTRIIAIVSKSEIERSSAQSLPQLLETLPGLDVRQRGAYSTQADLSIRAGSFDQVLILLNGVNISDPQTGHNNLNIPISLAAIERIEILEGAGLRYNSEGAFAGAINIVTKIANQNSADVTVSGGSYGYMDMGANIALKQKNISHMVDINATQSDGYRDNTDFDSKRLYYRSVYNDKRTQADFQMGYVDNAYGANGFYSLDYPNQFEQLNSFISSLRVTTGDKIKISPKAYYKRSFDRFELYRDGKNAASWYTGHNYHQTDVWGVGGDINFTSQLGKTNVGIDLRNERIRSNQLGESIDSIAHPKENDIYFTHGKERTNYNSYVNQTFYYNDFVVGSNMLINYNGISEEIKPYFGLDVAYIVNNSLSLKASANQSFRMPTFTELYYNGSTNIGNPDLTQEEAVTYDVGLDYSNNIIRFHISMYYRNGKDIIDWVKKAETDEKWNTMNYSEVRTKGTEMSLNIKPEKAFTALSFWNNLNTSFTYNNSEVKDQEYISRYALDYLKYKYTISSDFILHKQLTLSLMGHYQKRENPTADDAYEPFWQWDANVRWNGEHISPFVQITNVFDKTYYDFNGLPQPGRCVVAGVKFCL